MAQRDTSKTLALKQCPLCAFEARSIPLVLSHLRVVHSSDPHFIVTCGLSGCATTSKSFIALYSHIYRHHPGVINRYHSGVINRRECALLSEQSSSTPLHFSDHDTPSAPVITDGKSVYLAGYQ